MIRIRFSWVSWWNSIAARTGLSAARTMEWPFISPSVEGDTVHICKKLSNWMRFQTEIYQGTWRLHPPECDPPAVFPCDSRSSSVRAAWGNFLELLSPLSGFQILLPSAPVVDYFYCVYSICGRRVRKVISPGCTPCSLYILLLDHHLSTSSRPLRPSKFNIGSSTEDDLKIDSWWVVAPVISIAQDIIPTIIGHHSCFRVVGYETVDIDLESASRLVAANCFVSIALTSLSSYNRLKWLDRVIVDGCYTHNNWKAINSKFIKDSAHFVLY